MSDKVRHAYSRRASEYIAALGSIENMDPLDVTLITSWGRGVDGPILDAGSGPGHWNDVLRSLDLDTRGIDMVPEFVDYARKRFPFAAFEVGNLLDLPFDACSFGGILAWYSLIHLRPEDRDLALKEFARVLQPGGVLLVGAFLGPQGEPFEHGITEAFYWSEKGMAEHLESAGFEVVTIHTRSPEGSRPHLDVLARLS